MTKENSNIIFTDYTNPTANVVLSYNKSILLNNDVLQEDLFTKEIFDLIITSPPYNLDIKYNSHSDNMAYEDYLNFSEIWMRNCFKWSKPQARFCLNIPIDKNKFGSKNISADLYNIAQKIGWKYNTTIVWNKNNYSNRTSWGSWMSASAPCVITRVELIIVFYKEEWKKTGGTKISDITKEEFMKYVYGEWTFNAENRKKVNHPAPFPIELPYRCIKLFSYVDDVVFDPFAGSGTTLVTANRLNRRSIGVEIDKDYCQLAKSRILEAPHDTTSKTK